MSASGEACQADNADKSANPKTNQSNTAPQSATNNTDDAANKPALPAVKHTQQQSPDANTTTNHDGRRFMKAIETRYAGCNFRSRLEARWALFFDALDIPWHYEQQGYEWECDHKYCCRFMQGKKLHYLPDFWLPTINTWFEVKGERTDEEAQLHTCFAEEYTAKISSKARHITAIGDIPRTAEPYAHKNMDGMWLNGVMDEQYFWCQCNHCGKYGIEFGGRAGRICQHTNNDEDYTKDNTKISRALEIARSARFSNQK